MRSPYCWSGRRAPRLLFAICTVSAGLIAPALTIPAAHASPGAPGVATRAIHSGVTTVYHAGAPAKDAYARNSEIRAAGGPAALGRAATRGTGSPVNRSEARSADLVGAAQRSASSSNGVVRSGARLLRSFQGINHRDQRLANGGNQFSSEPPDQALCVGAGYVVEAVNDALRVYGTNGAPTTAVEDLNTFFGYPPSVLRTANPRVYGPLVTDPSCLFDPTTHKFFLTALTLGTDSATGAFTGQNQLDIAVTAHPTGSWTTYHLDVTDDGSAGTPVHPHCPCIGDYPHIGVDSHGFYITTNEYSFFGPEFNAAQIYAFSKAALASHADTVYVTQFDTTGLVAGNPGFTVWPAQSPNAAQYLTAHHGTEMFLSSTAAPEANGTGESTNIVIWALIHTDTLGTAHPTTTLTMDNIGVSRYTIPPPAEQKVGPTPLRDCLNNDACATDLNGEPDPYVPEVIQPLDSNDTRMQQVTYAGGLLYGALDTGVQVEGRPLAGIAYFVVQPAFASGHVSGSIRNQGTLALAGNNLTYPAIGVTSSGRGVIAFTLVGSGYYPSAAFAGFDAVHGPAAIQLAGAGAGPEDGFSGYKYYAAGGPGVARPRWGDYGATAVADNTIWAASEYIAQTCTLAEYQATPFGSCGGTRTALANWSTRISEIAP